MAECQEFMCELSYSDDKIRCKAPGSILASGCVRACTIPREVVSKAAASPRRLGRDGCLSPDLRRRILFMFQFRLEGGGVIAVFVPAPYPVGVRRQQLDRG